jgi:pSer/pThr/pTyr-binding forkhead associated (FHA) protein
MSATDVTVGGGGLATVAEPARSTTPTLRLITGGRVAETRLSGARAGRGAVELGLPDVPTVSREHARFTYSDGQWWVANLGMNGLTLNGASVAGEQPLHDGDVIRWGTNEQAPGSRVEIG